MRKTVFLIAIAAALTACSTTKTVTVWVKPGSSQESFDMDKGQCDAQAFSVAGGNLMQVAIVQNGCMRGKGWHLEDRQVPK